MKFGRKSIGVQLTWLMAAASLFFLAVCIFIYFSVKEMMYLNTDEYTKVTAEKLKNQLELDYENMQTFVMSLSIDEDIQKMMTLPLSEKNEAIQNVSEKFTQYKILEPSIADIALVSDEVHYSTVFREETLDEMRRAAREMEEPGWYGVRKRDFRWNREEPALFVYCGNIMADGVNIGTLAISMEFVFEQTEEERLDGSAYLLADRSQRLFAWGCGEEQAEAIFSVWKDEGGQGDWREGAYFIHAAYLADMDCYLVSALDTREAAQELGRAGGLIWLCVAVLLLFFLLLSVTVNRRMVIPLRKFDQAIRRLRSTGQRKLRQKLELDGCREIETIAGEFEGMLEDIERMNKKIFKTATDLYEMEVEKREAEIGYLRSQIDPHFLYNTLEAVRQMALVREVPEIAEMAVDMGTIFRYSTKGEPVVALEEELSIMKAYLRIQQRRFGGRIRVYYFIPEETLKLKVMKMLLQPVVENAIFHGLEPVSREGSLYIGARIEGEALCITVKDDGAGIPQERLRELQEALKSDRPDTSRHVGILNTHARIRLFYGEGYGLELKSSREGTTVELKIKAERG